MIGSEQHVLGLDPSLAATGWALASMRGRVLRTGTIKPADETTPFRDRARWIAEQIGALVVELRPAHVVAEAPWISLEFPRTGLELSFLSGAIGQALDGRAPVDFLDVGVWRKALGVRNNKAVVLAHVARLLQGQGIDPASMSEDAIEASGIALALVRQPALARAGARSVAR